MLFFMRPASQAMGPKALFLTGKENGQWMVIKENHQYSYLSNKRSTSFSFFAFLHVPTQLNSRYFFSFFPLLQVPSFILIMRRDTHILLLLFSVLHGYILYRSICKRAAESDFGIQIDIE